MDIINELGTLDLVEPEHYQDVLGSLDLSRRGTTKRVPEAALAFAYVRDLTQADLTLLAEDGRALTVPQRIDALTHRHHLAARMIADGMAHQEVMYATAYSGSYVTKLKADPAFTELVAYYAEQKDAIYLDVHQRLGSLGMSAVDHLQDRLDHLKHVGDDELADAKAAIQRAIMPNGQLVQITQLALDRSLAPARLGGGKLGPGGQVDLPGGLVVNLNFGEPTPQASPTSRPMVDVTPSSSPNAESKP